MIQIRVYKGPVSTVLKLPRSLGDEESKVFFWLANADFFSDGCMVGMGTRMASAKELMESEMQVILVRFCYEGKLKNWDSPG